MTILKFTKDFSAEQTEALHSFAETLAFISAEIYGTPAKLAVFYTQYPTEETGFIEQLNVFIAWAKEFEQLNEGREWDGEWYEAMETFIDSKLK